MDTLPRDVFGVRAAQERTDGSKFTRVAHSFRGHTFDLIRSSLFKCDLVQLHTALRQPALTIGVDNVGT